MLKFASLGSGSKGNATLVCQGETLILVDCGFALRELEKRLAEYSLSAAQLSAVLVTHEHTDHIRGVGALARKHAVPVYMTSGSHISGKCGQLPDWRPISDSKPFLVDQLKITPVAVPHDAREPCQFVFEWQNRKLGVLTDLGCITPHVAQAYHGCHALLVEANHDSVMLENGPYPPSLRARVASSWGHLNNQQTAEFIANADQSRLQQVLVGHISEKNNSLERVEAAVMPVADRSIQITYAEQHTSSGWFEVY